MKKRLFTLSLTAISLVGLGAAAVFSRPNVNKPVEARTSKTGPLFDGETEYTGDGLVVNAISSSKTDFSTSYQIQLSTGGNSVFDNAGTKCVYVFGYDTSEGGLISYAEDFQKKDVEEQDRIQEEIEAGLATTPSWPGYVFQFADNQKDVFIPETISRGTYGVNSAYDVEIDAVSEHAFKSISSVERLYIPATVKTIPEKAFADAQHLTDIYVEHASKPAGFEDGWDCGKTVHWGEDVYSYAPTQTAKRIYKHSQSTSLVKVGNNDNNFIFGYVPVDESKGHYPVIVEYKLVGSTETKWLEIAKQNDHADYDSVGGQIGTGASSNLYSNSFYADIELEQGQEVDFESIVVHNIFEAESKMEEGKKVFYPKMSARYYIKPGKVFSKVSLLSDYITSTFNTVASFGGHTSISGYFSKVNSGIDVYKDTKPYYYNIYKNNLASGKAFVRYRLTQLGNAKFVVDSGNGIREVDPDTPVIQYILRNDKNNNLGFVFNDKQLNDSSYSFKNIKSFAVKGMTLTIDIVNDGVIVKTTSARARFGLIYIKAPTDTLKTFDANLFVVLLAVGYSAAALVFGTALFFFYKVKYKNDEFKRLKPKQFITKGLIYWVTSLIVVLAITFIVLRCTVFANAIVVYNPVDVFIVIFGIASIIVIGYFVKNFVTAQKARNQRKRAIKLGLVNEVADDGTK